jgi:hypothetical protein
MLSALLCRLQKQGQLEVIEQPEEVRSNQNSYRKLLSNAGKSDICQIVTPAIVLLASRLVLDSLP